MKASNRGSFGAALTLLKASLMLPASRVVALLSELMTDPKSSKLVLISTRKLLSCGAVGRQNKAEVEDYRKLKSLEIQSPDPRPVMRRQSYFQDVFNDPLLVMVAGLQVLHVELKQIQRSGSCRRD